MSTTTTTTKDDILRRKVAAADAGTQVPGTDSAPTLGSASRGVGGSGGESSGELSAPRGEGFISWALDRTKADHDARERELASDEDRLRRNRVLATIGDGLSAFHEAYSKMRGTPVLTGGESLSGKMRERYDRIKAERAANDQAYINAALRLNEAQSRADERRERASRKAQEETNAREMNTARIRYWDARAKSEEAKKAGLDAKAKQEAARAEFYAKLYELVQGGMSEKDARVALGVEPKTTYTVSDKHDSSGKSSVTVTTRTGDVETANAGISRANSTLHGSGGSASGGAAQNKPASTGGGSAQATGHGKRAKAKTDVSGKTDVKPGGGQSKSQAGNKKKGSFSSFSIHK